jgi:hypothetical protein
MKTVLPLLLLGLLASSLHAEIRGDIRLGAFIGGNDDPVGTLELEARYHGWALAPAYDGIQGGYGTHATHINLRKIFQTTKNTYWIGAGPTWVRTNNPSSEHTWNVDAGMAWRLRDGAWEPFVSLRFYNFNVPVFRDEVEEKGAVLQLGISRRFFK